MSLKHSGKVSQFEFFKYVVIIYALAQWYSQ